MAPRTCFDFADFPRAAPDSDSEIDPSILARVFELVRAGALPALQAEIDAYHIARAAKHQSEWLDRNPGKPLADYWEEFVQ